MAGSSAAEPAEFFFLIKVSFFWGVHPPFPHAPIVALGQAATYMRKMWLGARTRRKYLELMEEFGRRGASEWTKGDSWVALSCAAQRFQG